MPIIEKNCLACGKPFRCWQRHRREQVTCGKECGTLARRKPSGPPKIPTPLPTKACEFCHSPFTPKVKKSRFCTKACAMRHRLANTDLLFRISARARNKTAAQLAATSRHIRRVNADPDIRARAAASKRGKSFCGVQGGNGQLTREQEILQKALGSGWSTEYPIKTGVPSWPCAVVDLANPALKIAIEVDGASHHTRKQKNRDARKTAILNGLGWVVLRFWNAEITGKLLLSLIVVRHAVLPASSRSNGPEYGKPSTTSRSKTLIATSQRESS